MSLSSSTVEPYIGQPLWFYLVLGIIFLIFRIIIYFIKLGINKRLNTLKERDIQSNCNWDDPKCYTIPHEKGDTR